MFYHLGRFAVRYRWWIVGLWIIAVAIALPFAPQAESVLQPGGFLSPDVEAQRAIDLLTQKLDLKSTIVQVVFTSRTYTADDPRFIQEADRALAGLRTWSEVASVTSFTDNPHQISLDRHAAYANVALNIDSDSAPKLLPELQRRLTSVPDLQVQVGGSPVFYADIQAVSESDLRRAEILAFPFAIIALLLVFRTVPAAVMPALVGGAAVLVTLAAIFALGQLLPLSTFVLNITTLFGLGLGVDYSLFIVSRFREELKGGHELAEAVAATVATAGRAVTFSGLTVSIGLLGLMLFPVNMLRSVGLGGVLVVLMAILAALTLLPAALSILGTRINALPVRLPRWSKRRQASAEQHGFWYRLAQFVMRYPVRIFLPVLLILIALGLPFLNVRFSSPDASILPESVPSRQVYDLLATRFDVEETTPIVLAVQTQGQVLTQANLVFLYNYVQRIEADPRVARVDSIVSADPRLSLDEYEQLYLYSGYTADPYLSTLVRSTVSGNTLAIQVISKYDALDVRSQALVQTIRNTPPGHGMSVLVTGVSAANIDYVDSLYTAFPLAILIVALVTYAALFFFFRSVILPLKAILMNTLSILASYGALVLIFQDGFLQQILGFTPLGFVEASSPILLFCALFGLSMDYEVFLLSRVQEAYVQTGDNRLAVALGLERSGGIITSAAVIVIVVSSCFATADMILVKALGLGMALAVAIDATLVRGLLVPATMRLLGNWNWWLPFKSRSLFRPGGLLGAGRFSRALFLPLLVVLALILVGCSVPGVPATSAQLPVSGTPPAQQAFPPMRFPQDEAPHRDLTEWWYYTGHLNTVTPDGQTHHYGFELVFFQALRSDYPPVYAAHFAISDITRGQFYYDQRSLTEPDAVIPNGTSTAGFALAINDWSISGLNGHDHLQASMNGYLIDLNLAALKPPVLHNGNGLLSYGPGGFSYYYSRTSMAVTGVLLDHQQRLSVSGEAWMDHQWGNFLILSGGWDWFSIQLNNQTEMMLYVIRDASGRTVTTYVELIEPDAQSLQAPGNDLKVGVLGHWTSPVTDINYPSGWRIQVDDPRFQVNLVLQPELKNQELVAISSTNSVYWEGAVSIAGSFSQSGQSHPLAVQGEGYVELTGYHR